MTRKVFLNVAVTITTNEENEHVGAMENVAASHIKNCLLDNPDVDVFTIQDVDVEIDGSEDSSEEDEEETPAPSYENKDGIEITPEILEKNFGYARGIGWYDVYFVREDEHDEHYFVTKYIAIRDAHRYPNKARFSVIRNREYNVLFNVKYVHELQRALRALGIDKNIIP